jgi:toxin ParE1/3/4
MKRSVAIAQRMAKYRLSSRAYADIVGIGEYTIERFGIEQARRYRDRLDDAIQTLADNPSRGRPADDVAPGLRRWNYQSHAVFFRLEARGILVVRVLHQRMDFERHPMSDE